MCPEHWCSSFDVLWRLSGLLSFLPSPFQEHDPCTVPYSFLCFQSLSYSPRLTGIDSDEQRRVLQADLETRRCGQHGRGPVGGPKAFSVPSFPFPCREVTLPGEDPRRCVGALLNPKAIHVPKGPTAHKIYRHQFSPLLWTGSYVL